MRALIRTLTHTHTDVRTYQTSNNTETAAEGKNERDRRKDNNMMSDDNEPKHKNEF